MPRLPASEPIDDYPTVVYTRTPTPPWTPTPRRPAAPGRVPAGPRVRSIDTVRVVRAPVAPVAAAAVWTLERKLLGFTVVLAVVVICEWLIL